MKKLLVFVSFVLAIFFLVWMLKEPIFSYYVYRKTGVDMTIGSLRIFSHEVIGKDIQLRDANGEKSLGIKKVSLHVPSFFQKGVFHIDQMEIEDVVVQLVCESPLCKVNNWTLFLQQIPKKTSSQKGVFIHSLLVKNLSFDVVKKGKFASRKQLSFPDMRFENISSQNGFPIQQLFVAIFRSVGFEEYLKGVWEKKGLLQNFFSIPATDSL